VTDEEIKEMIAIYGLDAQDYATLALCKEIERVVRHEFYSIIQHANNAAVGRSVTARDLDKLIWNHGHKKTANES
jgi:hypothetical protein